jgi:FKBP-type peptidyl-prolyl cis-trans isomerase 2
MRTVQQGDRVRDHYVKRFQDGSVGSSRGRGDSPLELTVGVDDPRLLGLGSALVGFAPGNHVTVSLPPDAAYGVHDPGRVRRFARSRFPPHQPLPVGEWVRVSDRRGRRRPAHILEVHDRVVVVDTNHPRAGRSLELELLAILGPDGGPVAGPLTSPAGAEERLS